MGRPYDQERATSARLYRPGRAGEGYCRRSQNQGSQPGSLQISTRPAEGETVKIYDITVTEITIDWLIAAGRA